MKSPKRFWRRASGDGFTLIEAIVALAILALSLGVLYESFGWSLRQTAVLEQREAAWLTAQSLLAEVRARPSLLPGSFAGEMPGFRWTTRIDARDAALDERASQGPFEVTIEVSWGSRAGQRVRLQSIEIARSAS